jgi:hypothetical protein
MTLGKMERCGRRGVEAMTFTDGVTAADQLAA